MPHMRYEYWRVKSLSAQLRSNFNQALSAARKVEYSLPTASLSTPRKSTLALAFALSLALAFVAFAFTLALALAFALALALALAAATRSNEHNVDQQARGDEKQRCAPCCSRQKSFQR